MSALEKMLGAYRDLLEFESPDEAANFLEAQTRKLYEAGDLKEVAIAGNGYAQYKTAEYLVADVHAEEPEPENKESDPRLREAFSFFAQAAARDFVLAHAGLAECYKYGEGTKPDGEKFEHYALLAIKQNNPDILAMLADYYNECERYAEALPLLIRAGERNHKECNVLAGDYYLKGLGVHPNPPMAARYYLLGGANEGNYAAELGMKDLLAAAYNGDFDPEIAKIVIDMARPTPKIVTVDFGKLRPGRSS